MPLASPGTRFVARDVNATRRPSGLMTGRSERLRIGLAAVGRDVHAQCRPQAAIPDEDVECVVGVTANEILRLRVEGDVAAVGADRRRIAARAGGEAGGLGAAARDADTGGAAGAAIVHEHVGDVVGVAGDEIGGVGRECDEAAVGADRRPLAIAIPLDPHGVDAYQPGATCAAVVDEHVAGAVRVAADEVPGGRRERDETPVGADGGKAARAVALTAAASHADPRRPAGHAVMDEHVREAVGIADDEVACRRDERDEAAVRAHAGGA